MRCACIAQDCGGANSSCLICWPTYPETNATVACILGTTRSALSRRSRQVSLSPSCCAMVRIVSMWHWISPAMSFPLRRTPRSRSTKWVGVADGADTLADLLALCAEALVLVASGCHVLCNLLQ